MPFDAIDLFCGVGGLTKGLELADINVIAGVDVDNSCRFAYEENNQSIFINKDIKEIDANELNILYPENSTKILVGCAPCQPFSKYTKRYRKDGHVDDKWQLLNSFDRIITEIQPDIVSMENVPELSNEDIFFDFVSNLEDGGYSVHWDVFYGPDYGVPQKRKRLVLLASKLGEIEMIDPIYNPQNYPTVRQTIGGLPEIAAGEVDANDNLHRSSFLSEKNIRRIRQSNQGGTWRDWDEELRLKCHKKDSGKTYPSVYGRMSWDEPSPTITTQFYGYGNGRFGHPEQDRAISLREGAMLQSFPQDYRFVADNQVLVRNKIGMHIGNAVPVELGRAIGLSIRNHLNEVGING